MPIMANSLRKKAGTRLALYEGAVCSFIPGCTANETSDSLPFISIFTDMVGRLPKHRTLPLAHVYPQATLSECRFSFFEHLVKSLGPSEYLGLVIMLLIEKLSSRSVRNVAPAVHSIELPLSLTARFDVDLCLSVSFYIPISSSRQQGNQVILDLLQEVDCLVEDISRDEKQGILNHM